MNETTTGTPEYLMDDAQWEIKETTKRIITGGNNWVTVPQPPPQWHIGPIEIGVIESLESLAGDLGITAGYHSELDQQPSPRHFLDSLSLAYLASPKETVKLIKQIFDVADIFDNKYGVGNE